MISVITLEVFWDKRFLYAQIMSIEETKTILWKSKLLKNLIINISMGLNLVKTSQNTDVYINQNYKGWSINEGWELTRLKIKMWKQFDKKNQFYEK